MNTAGATVKTYLEECNTADTSVCKPHCHDSVWYCTGFIDTVETKDNES